MRARLPLLIALAGACAPSQAPTTPHAAVSAALPPVDLLTLDGQPARLEAALGGRPALVSLWATWCDACASEFDALGRLSTRAQLYGAVVVGVAVGEPHEQVRKFVASHGLEFAKLVDEQFVLSDALGQRRVPTTLIVDRGGRVVFRGGALDSPALAALQAALN